MRLARGRRRLVDRCIVSMCVAVVGDQMGECRGVLKLVM